MQTWYKKYCFASPLKHDDWNAFRDPDQLVYRTYNLLQDGQESYVQGLFDQFSDRGHDQMLTREWIEKLARIYTPSRYVFHALQMGSAYIHQIAPASTITNCATYETADHLRWLTHTAYRTKELANSYPDVGFGERERDVWENDPAWQGFRELIEKALTAWDWGEAFTAINLVTKPAVEEALLQQLGSLAQSEGDTLLGLLTQAQKRDAERHRRWSSALVKMALENEANREVLQKWIAKWEPLADKAIEAYCSVFSDGENAVSEAKSASRYVREMMGL
jgi:toluene monooxygenase system protein E